MASITVRTRNFPAVIAVIAGPALRAKVLPTRYRRSTRRGTKLGVIHHRGATQFVVSEAQRGAIRTKVGPGVPVPAVGRAMRHPRRPVRARRQMARKVVDDLARHVLHGGKRQALTIMLKDIALQFAAGGTPSWPRSKNWGRLAARRPTLGGAGGRVMAAWRRGRGQELR